VEVKTKSRTIKVSDNTAHLLGREAKQIPHMTGKELQEGSADTAVVDRCLTVQL